VEHLVHWDDVEPERGEGATVSDLGSAAATRATRCERVEVDAAQSWPLESSGDTERISYVVAGAGELAGAALRAGDCALHPSRSHSLVAGEEGIDVIAFEARSLRLLPARDQAVVVNVEDAESEAWAVGSDMAATSSFLGKSAGSVVAGLNVDFVAEGMLNTAPHCHSAEEEIFVVLDGEGTLLLGEDEHPVRRGHVVARPPGSRIGHAFRAATPGLTVLLHGTREPSDITYYPRSGIVALRGVGLRVRVENVDPDEIF
jgi:uncharacterized cupin superfamily protein